MRKKNTSAEFIKNCYADALIELMATQNYYDISVSDICKVAGFGRTSFYRHFTNNKDDILFFQSHYGWENYRFKHKEECEKDEGGQLMNYLYSKKDYLLMLSNKGLNHIIFHIVFDEVKVKEHENQIMAYGKAFFAGAYFGVIYEWIARGCVDTLEQIEEKFKGGIMFALAEAKKKEDEKNSATPYRH